MDSQRLIEKPFRLIADQSSLLEILSALPEDQIVGLDTETFWNPTNRQSRVALIQIATPLDEAFVLDALALDLEPLRPFIESPTSLMAAHNARFDQMVLAGAGFEPRGFIDTLQLARMTLSLSSYSLASVSEHLFGIALDKTLRTSNWRRRPLTKAQLAYAAADARVALQVYEELRSRLEASGSWDAALRAAAIGPVSSSSEVKRKRRVKQELSPPLTEDERRVVKSLKGWRLRQANALRVPAYMICPDKTLEHLARVRPESLEALTEIYGLGPSKISKFGEELIKALREACEGSGS